jgi:hypothetical protein
MFRSENRFIAFKSDSFFAWYLPLCIVAIVFGLIRWHQSDDLFSVCWRFLVSVWFAVGLASGLGAGYAMVSGAIYFRRLEPIRYWVTVVSFALGYLAPMVLPYVHFKPA